MNPDYAYGMWFVAVFNIGLFLFFLGGFLPPKGRVEWRNMGLLAAFLVALFTEMYGFPLTIYLLTGWLGSAYPALNPYSHQFGHLWAVLLGGSVWAWAAVMGLSIALQIGGYILLSKGWQLVHAQSHGIATDGVYRFVRHPQYTGLLLFIAGFLVQWPTLPTIVMAPILMLAYMALARSEERAMVTRHGDAYQAYLAGTPAFFPHWRDWPDFLRAQPLAKNASLAGSESPMPAPEEN